MPKSIITVYIQVEILINKTKFESIKRILFLHKIQEKESSKLYMSEPAKIEHLVGQKGKHQ